MNVNLKSKELISLFQNNGILTPSIAQKRANNILIGLSVLFLTVICLNKFGNSYAICLISVNKSSDTGPVKSITILFALF